MASPEIIGLLCAGSTRYHAVSNARASDALSGIELSGLLCGLDDAAMYYAMAKYASDVDSERRLIAMVRVWAAGLAVKDGWVIVRGRPTISNLSALAVFEGIRPNRCGRCSGTGFRSNRVCTTCGGTGFKPLSGRQIAEAIGVDEAHYRRVWKSRFDSVYAYVHKIESKVCIALRHNDTRTYSDHQEIAC